MGRRQKHYYEVVPGPDGLALLVGPQHEDEEREVKQVLPWPNPEEPIRLVRVSRVKEKTIPKEALVGWAYNTALEGAIDVSNKGASFRGLDMDQAKAMLKDYGYSPWQRSSKASDRGTEAHTVLERLSAGGEHPAEVHQDIMAMAPEVRGYALAVLDWFMAAGRGIVASELGLVSMEHQFAGTTDLVRTRPMIAPDPGEQPWLSYGITDLKTSKAVYEDHPIQLGAYALAVEEMADAPFAAQVEFPVPPGTRVTWGSILLARPDGTWEEHDVEPQRDVWLSLIPVYRLRFGRELVA